MMRSFALVFVAMAIVLVSCGKSSGIVVGLSDDELRADYGPAAGEMEEAAGGGFYGNGYDSEGAAPPSANRPPTIESVSFVGDTITVIASDPDGDVLAYRYILLSGEVAVFPTGDGSTAVVATVLDGAVACEVRIIVSDGRGGEDSATVSGTTAGHPPENSILMLFDRASVSIGEPVTVIVYAYKIAYPLLYLDSAMIEFNAFLADTAGGKFSAETMNLGAVGGAVGEPDGIWANLPVGDYVFFAGAIELFGPYDADYYVNDQPVPTGRKYLAVNASPFFTEAAIPPGSSGALFNFTLVPHTAGMATFSFVREYRQSLGGALIAGTLYSPSISEHNSFFDEQVAAIEVGE